jgi:prevent-host-death family protein
MAERVIAAGEFKARCLQLMDEVAETGDDIVVTKHGKPVARLVPAVSKPEPTALFGFCTDFAKADPKDALLSAWDEGDAAALETELDRSAELMNRRRNR